MNGNVIRGAALAALLLGVTRGAARSDDPQEILGAVRKKYETIRDAELRFTQHTRFPQSSLEQRAKGTLYLKKSTNTGSRPMTRPWSPTVRPSGRIRRRTGRS